MNDLMRKYLEGYLEVNQLPAQTALLEAGDLLIEQPTRPVYNFSKLGYVLTGFQALVQEQIPVEEFFQLGELDGTEQIDQLPVPPAEGVFCFKTMLATQPVQFDDSLVVVDQHAVTIYRNETEQLVTSEQFDQFALVVL